MGGDGECWAVEGMGGGEGNDGQYVGDASRRREPAEGADEGLGTVHGLGSGHWEQSSPPNRQLKGEWRRQRKTRDERAPKGGQHTVVEV